MAEQFARFCANSNNNKGVAGPLSRHPLVYSLICMIIAFALTSEAKAGLVPIQVSVTPSGGLHRYTYAVLLPTDAILRSGDYFTIYDFDGYVAGSDKVSGSPYANDWTFEANPLGRTPSGVTPTDSTSILNLTWTYNGPLIGLESSVGLGNFWAESPFPTTTKSWFAARTGTTGGSYDDNITPTVVPVPTSAPPVVPEPSTFLLAALGLPLLAIVRSRFKGQATEPRKVAIDTNPG